MVEINEAERKKEKRIEMRTTTETSGTILNTPTFKSQEFWKKTKRKGMRKFLSTQQLKTFLKWGRKQPPKSKKPRESQQDKPKAKHPRTQTNEDQTQRANIKSSKGKATNNTQGDSHKDDS